MTVGIGSDLKTAPVIEYSRSLGVKVLAADEFSVQSLMKLGLTEYEARIYVVLVKMGPRNASEISFLGKVPRPKTYGAIRGLESKGLLRIVTGKPERYMAVSPNDVLIPLVDKVSRETSECVQVVENLSVAFESSKYVYTEKPYERYDLWSVRGRDKVYKRVQDMIGEAKVNVFFCTTANGLVRLYKAHSEILEKASQRGAKVRIVAPVNQTNASVARELNEVIEVRNATIPMVRFVSADSAEIIFTEDIPDDTNVSGGQDVGTWTNDPLMVKSHEKTFDQLWSTLQTREPVKAKAAAR
jgi:sugar-specific transcriptional regulator TrmB